MIAENIISAIASAAIILFVFYFCIKPDKDGHA